MGILFWFLISLLVTLPVALFVLAFFFIVFRGAYFAATNEKVLSQLIDIVQSLKQETDINQAVDLGSGDGRVVLALSRLGIKTTGFEVNPILVQRSKKLLRQAEANNITKIVKKNFWHVNLAQFDLVNVFGIGYMMAKLESKLLKELKPGAFVVSYYFKFPSWQPKEKHGNLYLYQR